jgi:hypothetical protein
MGIVLCLAVLSGFLIEAVGIVPRFSLYRK